MPQSHNGDSNTAAKVRKMPQGVPFTKGDDPRRNLKGRPKSFEAARELAQAISHEELTLKDGRTVTVAEAILRSWAKDTRHQRDFIEYAFGKVPDKLETTGLENKTSLVLHFDHERGMTEEARK